MQQLIFAGCLCCFILAVWGIAAVMSGAQVFDHEDKRRGFDEWEEGE